MSTHKSFQNRHYTAYGNRCRVAKPLKKGILFSFLVAIFLGGIYLGRKHIIPFVNTRSEYMIGIYSGPSPFTLKPSQQHNPVVTAAMVHDVRAEFVADPFMINEQGKWYMFFEIMKEPEHKGVIGLATSIDAQEWSYEQVVLEESFHLSYPMVFKHNDVIYMMPECQSNYEICIYTAEHFPYDWQKEKTLITGNYLDPTIFWHYNHWYLFTVDRNDILHLFWADTLHGPWHVHPKSPIVKFDLEHARPCGRIVKVGNSIIRFAQNCKPNYGWDIRAFIVTNLTPQDYDEVPYYDNPLLKGSGVNTDWNGIRMHHIDLHPIGNNAWIAAVDGVGRWHEYGLGIFGKHTLMSIGSTFSFKSPYHKR